MPKQQPVAQKQPGPNFRVQFDDEHTRIVRTAAAVDRTHVFPTLAHARVELKHRARLHAENTLLAAKIACEVREKDVVDGDAEAAEAGERAEAA